MKQKKYKFTIVKPKIIVNNEKKIVVYFCYNYLNLYNSGFNVISIK